MFNFNTRPQSQPDPVAPAIATVDLVSCHVLLTSGAQMKGSRAVASAGPYQR